MYKFHLTKNILHTFQLSRERDIKRPYYIRNLLKMKRKLRNIITKSESDIHPKLLQFYSDYVCEMDIDCLAQLIVPSDYSQQQSIVDSFETIINIIPRAEHAAAAILLLLMNGSDQSMNTLNDLLSAIVDYNETLLHIQTIIRNVGYPSNDAVTI